ncbi:hypothetical protein, partial [Tropicimonas sp. IMCC6043]|uniref:hypothetical protein n=1 Tax=Tropicimonas sp. IMCC6043 TaxID=2510645 RepID=UPI0013ED72D6
RADHLSYSRSQGRPDYHASLEWPFVNGSAFMEKLPHFNHGTHMVASWYQVWQGADPEDADLEMTADEEKLLDVLLEAMRAPEVEMETTTEAADR